MCGVGGGRGAFDKKRTMDRQTARQASGTEKQIYRHRKRCIDKDGQIVGLTTLKDSGRGGRGGGEMV